MFMAEFESRSASCCRRRSSACALAAAPAAVCCWRSRSRRRARVASLSLPLLLSDSSSEPSPNSYALWQVGRANTICAAHLPQCDVCSLTTQRAPCSCTGLVSNKASNTSKSPAAPEESMRNHVGDYGLGGCSKYSTHC